MSDNFVDINNLGLEDEPLGADFNPSANSFSGPPPLPKGTYLSSVAFREADQSKRFQEKEYKTDKGHAPGLYYATKLVATVVSPTDFAGRKIFDDFVSTGVWQDNTSTIASILHVLGRGEEVVNIAKTGGGHKAIARLFAVALAAEPLLRLSVDWEGRVKEEDGTYTTLYKTMTEFKQREDGSYDPIIRDAEGNQIGVARLKVKGYFAAPNALAA
jgi:hypothetical protein